MTTRADGTVIPAAALVPRQRTDDDCHEGELPPVVVTAAKLRPNGEWPL
jgi:hypothetical protein